IARIDFEVLDGHRAGGAVDTGETVVVRDPGEEDGSHPRVFRRCGRRSDGTYEEAGNQPQSHREVEKTLSHLVAPFAPVNRLVEYPEPNRSHLDACRSPARKSRSAGRAMVGSRWLSPPSHGSQSSPQDVSCVAP